MMSYKFSKWAVQAHWDARNAREVLEAAYAARGEEMPRREVQPPMVGCEAPAWVNISDMGKYLSSLPPGVDRGETIAELLASGCPIQRFTETDYFWGLRVLDEINGMKEAA